MILPFFAVFFCGILFFFRLLQVQQDVEQALCYAARETAVLAHESQENWDGIATGETLFYNQLKELETPVGYVDQSWSGFSFVDSAEDEAYIDLCVSYQVDNPLTLLGIWKYNFTQRAKCHKWQGAYADQGPDETYVYITDYGSVYHLSMDCAYLDLSIQRVPYVEVNERRNLSGQRYRSCEVCGGEHGAMVYLTDYGETYHSDISCSGLRRGIYRIPLDQAEGYGLCSKCAQTQKGGN
ncbi:MAG: TadE family protein [Roseburia sp.]